MGKKEKERTGADDLLFFYAEMHSASNENNARASHAQPVAEAGAAS